VIATWSRAPPTRCASASRSDPCVRSGGSERRDVGYATPGSRAPSDRGFSESAGRHAPPPRCASHSCMCVGHNEKASNSDITRAHIRHSTAAVRSRGGQCLLAACQSHHSLRSCVAVRALPGRFVSIICVTNNTRSASELIKMTASHSR
jgi:hypothetical protein